MLKLFDEKKANILIIDVRENGGGNNFLIRSFVDKIEAHERVNREGNLFLITGRHTFSAAMDFSTGVEQRTKVLIVGEPGGSRPNSYGDAKSHLLPNSNITVRLSTIYWQDSTPDDARLMILPDIEAPPTFAHYTEKRDPALEAIFRYRCQDSLEMSPSLTH